MPHPFRFFLRKGWETTIAGCPTWTPSGHRVFVLAARVGSTNPGIVLIDLPVIPLCDNPHKTGLPMRVARLFLVWMGIALIARVSAQAQAPVSPSPPTLVLAGGTLIDVTDWGHSAKDLPDAIVFIRDGHISDVGTRAALPIPKGVRVIDCTGKYLLPGMVDGFAGMNSQGQANANLYMGVTTVVASQDDRRGLIDFAANPSPHIYLLDSIGSTDDWSMLAKRPDWAAELKEGAHPAELSPDDTARQLTDTAKLGTRVLWLGHDITAANTQWIIAHAHQLGMVTYGEFVATPYQVGVESGVDSLLHMSRYELGVIPDELQQPLVEDSEGSAATTAYDYSERLPATDPHVGDYAHFLARHHAALMPTFSLFYLQLPGHRNLWKEPAAALLDPAGLFAPPDRKTGELEYPLIPWQHRLPMSAQRWLEEGLRKKADLHAMRLWRINQVIFAAYPHYLAASGAPAFGSMPGIGMHTELELLVRLGLSPREALAAATNNYALQFGWNELGLIASGRRADILVLDADPTRSVWNVRHISTLIMDGNVLDRDALLELKH